MAAPKDPEKRKLWKEGISNTLKGRLHSEEYKENMRKATKGKHEGKDNSFFGKHHTKAWKEARSILYKGKNNPMYGKKRPDLVIRNWKGGISLLSGRIKSTFQYRQWRSDVFTRDNFTCQKCGKRASGKLNAHHKESFASILEINDIRTIEQAINCEELWNINNGITKCVRCHKEIHRKGKEMI